MVEEHEVDMTDSEPSVEEAQARVDDVEPAAEEAEPPVGDVESAAEVEPPVEEAEPPVDVASTSAEAAEMGIETVERVATGHDEIDAAMRRLDELDSLPVDQHGEILDELHGHLRDALAAAASPSSGRSDD